MILFKLYIYKQNKEHDKIKHHSFLFLVNPFASSFKVFYCFCSFYGGYSSILSLPISKERSLYRPREFLKFIYAII